MVFVEQLLFWKLEDSEGKFEDEFDIILIFVFLQVVELLGNFLWIMDMVVCVKEFVFYFLVEFLCIVYILEQRWYFVGLFFLIVFQLNFCLVMLMVLQLEFYKLYDEEMQNWVLGSICGGFGGLVVGDQGRFFMYFYVFMEGCLVVVEVILFINMSVIVSGVILVIVLNFSDLFFFFLFLLGQILQSFSFFFKRKKVKMKWEKVVLLGKCQFFCIVDLDFIVFSIGGSKFEDMLWFYCVFILFIIFCYFIRKDLQGLGVMSDVIVDVCQVLVGFIVYSCLFVIFGIFIYLDEGVVRGVICKVCNVYGGVFKDEIYILLQEEDFKKLKDKVEGGDGKVEFEKILVFFGLDSMEVSMFSSLMFVMSISVFVFISQVFICSFQGIF